MPICITCSTPVKHLYTTYSKADDRSLGKGVRLTQCPRCKRFADKYVEHDFVVLFIDLVLIKPQVYRHLLFNRLGRSDSKLDPSILRLGTLLILFDVYLTWARIEGAALKASSLDDAPILTQYLFFLTLKVLATTAQHVTVRMLVKFFVTGRDGVGGQPSPMPPAEGSPGKDDGANGTRKPESPHPGADAAEIARPRSTSPAAITTALLVSSCTKLFPILLEIWSGDDEKAETKTFNATFASRASTYVGWAVLLNNIEALLILLDCGYIVATGLAVAGAVARYVVEKMVLGAVGLEGDGMAAPIKTFGSIASRTGKLLGVG